MIGLIACVAMLSSLGGFTEIRPDRDQPLLVAHYEDGRKGEILSMNPEDGSMTNLTENPLHTDNYPSWSPNGARIAFNSHRTGGWAVWMMDADGSSPMQLLKTPSRTLNASWSPDGEMVTFFGDPNGYWNIGISMSDGTGLRWLTNDQNINRDPSFHPDGDRVLFYSTRATGRELDLFEIEIVGGGVTNLTSTPEMNEFAPAYSPDGSMIGFYELPRNATENTGNVVVINSDGTDRRVLTQVQGGPGRDYRDVRLTWTADGEEIVFIGYRGARDGQLFRIAVDGSTEADQIEGLQGHVSDPSWCSGCEER